MVRVPVLSDAMISVEPRVSTAGNLRIMAFRLAKTWVPSDRTTVTIAGRPSGIAATARATEVIKAGKIPSPRTKTDTAMVMAAIIKTA